MKLKECSVCKQMVLLWKSTPKLCKKCSLKISSSEPPKSKTDIELPNKSKSSSNRIKSTSDKRLVQLKEYRKKRDSFLKDNCICQFPKCTKKATDLHHSRGRIGSLLNDERYFKALCRPHHIWVEENVNEAKSMGLSASRLEKER